MAFVLKGRQYINLAQYAVIPVLPANPYSRYHFCSSRACKQTRILCFQSLECSLTFCCLLGVVAAYERKICLNKGQVCHFLTVPHILLHKCSINQEMPLMSLVNVQKLLKRVQKPDVPSVTQNSIRFSSIISSHSTMVRFLDV